MKVLIHLKLIIKSMYVLNTHKHSMKMRFQQQTSVELTSEKPTKTVL